MAQGNSKANKWAIVVNAKKSTPSNAIRGELEALLCSLKDNTTYKYYFANIHDKDTEDGKPKRTHLHLVIEYNEKRTFAAVMEDFTKKLKVNREQVSLESTNSECLAEQYLVHKNDSDKYQYDPAIVVSNDMSEWVDRFRMIYRTAEEKEQDRMKALYTARDMIELIEMAGLDFANRYRGIFKDIRTDRQQDIKGLETALSNERIRYANLLKDLNNLILEIDSMNTIKTPKQFSLALTQLLMNYKLNVDIDDYIDK